MREVTVLKFGGSVLRDEARLRIAVHEIYRWYRDGHAVLGVVSALAGRTDQLLRHARACAPPGDAHAQAAIVAAGELESAALLGQHLSRAGIVARVMGPQDVGLLAEGPALDADPVSFAADTLRRALGESGVVVFPGYVAYDAGRRPVVLGRGGSDLTALFLAHGLGASRCRLIKDVDGLYEHDPAAGGPRPRRYARATFEMAAAMDGSVVQHKAVCFAQRHGVRFELGQFNTTTPTQVGTPDSAFGDCRAAEPCRIGLLGLGTVGRGVLDLLDQIPALAEVVGIAVRRPQHHRARGLPARLLTADVQSVVAPDLDLVVEVIGGCDVAGAAVEAALRRGVDVVTANKALLAQRGGELQALAGRHGATLRSSASVGGVMPVLECVCRQRDRGFGHLRAVLNGTTNFVLERCAAGVAFDAAVQEAQRLGFAEADPSRDLGGRDALDKLHVIARALGLQPRGVETCEALDAERLQTLGHGTIRHVATLDADGSMAVRLEALADDDPLATVHEADNAAVLAWADGAIETVRGQGAGRWPTAEAVVADVLEYIRTRTP